MSNKTDFQLRGHCQCCSRVQAAQRGRMSQHGYTVENGWFNGVCQGHRFQPLEQDRTVADSTVASVRKQVVELQSRYDAFAAGRAHPEMVGTGRMQIVNRKHQEIMVPWAEAAEYQQASALRSAMWRTEQRINAGTRFANELEALANRVHGQPLMTVKKPAALAPIPVGDRRLNPHGRLLVATRIEGGRVYWSRTSEEGKTFSAWTGAAAWRKLPLAEKPL